MTFPLAWTGVLTLDARNDAHAASVEALRRIETALRKDVTVTDVADDSVEFYNPAHALQTFPGHVLSIVDRGTVRVTAVGDKLCISWRLGLVRHLGVFVLAWVALFAVWLGYGENSYLLLVALLVLATTWRIFLVILVREFPRFLRRVAENRPRTVR